MAEGPQILLRTRWLHRHTAGKTPRAIRAHRADLEPLTAQLQGLPIRSVSCRGKLLWFEFEGPNGPLILQNQLLMDGRWRRHAPGTPLPPTTWLAFEFEDQTIANHGGQLFRISNPAELSERLAQLGPDVMEEPYPTAAITTSLQASQEPIAEALLDQSLLCGIGKTAKSEALFLARIDPRVRANDLAPQQLESLSAALERVTRGAITDRGRWRRRVYQRAEAPCPNCRTPIALLRQANRDIFACPRCQGLDPTLQPPPNFHLGCAIWAFPGWVGSLYRKRPPVI